MASDEQRRIIRVSGIITVLFLLLLGWQSYWHLSKSDWLMNQPTNRRMARSERNTARGTIYDRHGSRLAWSENGARRYADSRATAAVLGYIDPVYGRVGVEGAWNLELAGLSQKFTVEELHRILSGEKPHGKDIVLTLDLTLQRAALAALGNQRGAVVMLEPKTGGILAVASNPTYDAQDVGKHYKQLARRTDGVLRNRATQDHYPPGSTMKLVTASAALMHGVDPDTRYTCIGNTPLDGTTIRDYHGEKHGTIAMPTALAESCNYYFARTAVELGQASFYETAQGFGFNQRWWEKKSALLEPRMLPLQMTESSLNPDLERRLPTGEFAQMGFGQATIVVTPLQMAMICAGIANDGTVMAPYLVSDVRKGGSSVSLERFHSEAIGYPLNSDHADELIAMMRKVVTSGTATRARHVPGVTVYGKTGTAQQRGGQDHAWFVGFGERQVQGSPERVAFAVIIERGGTGGRIAVPVATQVLEDWGRSND